MFAFPRLRGGGEDMTQILTLVADTQVHYLYGRPTALRSEVLGGLARQTQVAIRPVQLDLYSGTVLEVLLAQQNGPYVYLGDAGDLSCKQELTAVLRAFQGKTWVMAPGNHDGYFYGHRHLDDRLAWAEACGGDSALKGPLTKADFVEMYLRALVASPVADAGVRRFACWLWGDRPGAAISTDGEWVAGKEPKSCAVPPNPDGPDFLRAVAWHIDRSEPWRSFVIQEIDWTQEPPTKPSSGESSIKPSSAESPTKPSSAESPIKPSVGEPPTEPAIGIVLDTAAYADKPVLVPLGVFGENAGLRGDLPEAEHDIADRWARDARARRAVVTLFGHHDYDSLTRAAKARFDDLRREHDIPLYVSAHTHEGFWKVHEDGKRPWVEVNVGSTTDWPPQVRSLSLGRDDGRLRVSSQLFRLDALLQSPETHLAQGGLRCDPEWEAKPTDPAFDDYYLTYMDQLSPDPDETRRNLLDTLLRSQRRLFTAVPSASTSPGARPFCEKGPSPASPGVRCADDSAILKKLEDLLRAPPGFDPARSTEKSRAEERARTDEKAELLEQLASFDLERTKADEEKSVAFRVCQALWASKYEYFRSRHMERQEENILLPWR